MNLPIERILAHFSVSNTVLNKSLCVHYYYTIFVQPIHASMRLKPETKQSITAKAQAYFDEGYACSQAVLLAYCEHFNLDERTAKLISSSFGGGMGRLRQTCGAVTGGFMVLGLAYGNEKPKDMKSKLFAYQKVRELYHQVEEIHGTVNCKELLYNHATQAQVDEREHHKIICRQLVGEVAGMLHEVLAEKTQS